MTFNRLRTLVHNKISTGEFEITKQNDLFDNKPLGVLTEEISMFSKHFDSPVMKQLHRYKKFKYGSIQIPKRTVKRSSMMEIRTKTCNSINLKIPSKKKKIMLAQPSTKDSSRWALPKEKQASR